MADATGELVQWLGEQLDEDERIRDDWHHRDCESIPVEGHNGPFPCDCGVPERVLREIEGKRQLLAEFTQTGSVPDTPERRASPSWQGDFGYLQGLARAVHLMASAYADRPGYREEWRP